ncbi:hypothetical protein OIU76_023788 [Salix suchowensis]|nr:hypothetical protein OIU76_023788 [Salix suchowensis]
MDGGSVEDAMVGGGYTDEPHVLAVDDNLIDRKLVERLLKNSSCKVTTAENGLRALEYLGLGDEKRTALEDNVSKVNLIITDYCMPGMTGYELLKKIKESSSLKEIPVVIMSSENIPTRINNDSLRQKQVLGGRSSDVHAEAPQAIRCGETEM